MSRSPSEPENASSASSMKQEQGLEDSAGTDHIKPTKWTRSSRTNSTSLLTQALAAHQETEEAIGPPSLQQNPPAAPLSSLSQLPGSPQDLQNNGTNVEDDMRVVNGRTEMDATSTVPDTRRTRHLGFSHSSTPALFRQSDISHVEASLATYKDYLNNNRGRGTSLERTAKEKRVQDSPKGTYSTNPGDTALPPSPFIPTSANALVTISTNPPTDGVRAKYQLWRNSLPGIPPEKAWSIGDDQTDDMLGGQVEKSIKDAMAGVEPNSRSRKASHSLRFFKEGLPEDKSKKRDGKSRTRSKERHSEPKTSSRLSQPPLGRSGIQESNAEHQSPVSSPHETDVPSTKLATTANTLSLARDSSLASVHEEGYFDSAFNHDLTTEEQLKTLPSALLAEIRKHHNLTPGATKGSSFSASMPVTESEKNKPTEINETNKVSENSRSVENHNSDDQALPDIRSPDEEDESGEEQISSALFVPHKTPHDSPVRTRSETRSPTRPRLQDPKKPKDPESQEWLEEYEVLPRDVDQQHTSQDPKPRAIPPTPTQNKPQSPYSEKENYFSEPDLITDDYANASEGGYSTAGEESSIVDDDEPTPTGSLKQENLTGRIPFIHNHQQAPRQPLEAIELIPYKHQVGGHTTMWRFSKRAVCKQLNNRENEFYEKIERYHPRLLKFLPRYIGVLNVTFERQIRRKSTRKDLKDTGIEKQSQDGEAISVAGPNVAPAATQDPGKGPAEHSRVISQSLSSSSVPIPTVTFADNRHIIPKNFMQPQHNLEYLELQSKTDVNRQTIPRAAASPTRPNPNGDIKYRPSLSEKHAVSWGATTVNKQLRNQIFNEAFLAGPIPMIPHKKPATQNRSLPNRSGNSGLRVSNSESSLKTAQQSQPGSAVQPIEQSIRKKAIKAAAEQRNESVSTASTDLKSGDEEKISTDDEAEAEFSEMAGTSAPEPDIARSSPQEKRQRRYSSGGLRRKPAEVQESRGDLKYFEQADDVDYKGDTEDELFHMDPEPLDRAASTPAAADDSRNGPNGAASNNPHTVVAEDTSGTTSTILGPESSSLLDLPRPVNPKEAQTQRDSRVEYFLLLEDLTTGMKRPCIMDLKMGTRQYGVQANEKKQQSQRRKCADTTSKELGVRVCGLQVWDIKKQEYIFLDKYFGRDLKVGRPFQDALKRFLYDGVDYSSVLRHIPTILRKLSQLELIIQGLGGYRFYAASLLLFYDGDTQEDYESDSAATGKDLGKKNEIDFKIADFANCVTKEDVRLSEQPAPPQHPELPDNGFLRGLRSLRRYFIAIQRECQVEMGFELQDSGNVSDSADDDSVMSY